MDPSDPFVSFCIIFFSLVASAFFSGCEIAFVSANRLKIELDYKQGIYSARILDIFYKKPAHFIGAMLVGNNIALVIYGIEMGDVLSDALVQFMHLEIGGLWNLLIQTILSTILILFTAEFMPKAMFSNNPNGILNGLAIPLVIFYFILWIPMFFTVGLSELILRWLFRVEVSLPDKTFGKVDLDHYIKEVIIGKDETESIDHEIQIFQNALDFSKTRARDCMVPRNEIVAAEFHADIADIKKKFIETKLSKILIYKENIDNIIGYVHSYELFKKPKAVKSILLPLFVVPETSNIQDVLQKFTSTNRGVALVVDEFGGTSGMLTIEDVIEEIVGEIEDEHDNDNFTEIKLNNDEYLFSARLEIDYLNEKYKLDLPAGEEYDTLAGLALYSVGEIPTKKTKIDLENYRLTIEEVADNKIEQIKVSLKQDD